MIIKETETYLKTTTQQSTIQSDETNSADNDNFSPNRTYITDKVKSASSETDSNSTGGQNYIVEPLDNGFFKVVNAPEEPMSTVDELNTAVNQFRTAHGKSSLEIDSSLCSFADRRAHEISQNFTHDQFSKYFEDSNAPTWGFSNFGENIWQGKFMGVHIVEFGWAKSPGHFAALVGDWTKGCGGIYEQFAAYEFAR